jgi:MOB kinase activator 1
MNWIQSQIDSDAIFPSTIGVMFPKNFILIAKNILKRLFRVYAHIYYEHFHQVIKLQEEPHLNTSFKHFIYFVQEFDLVEKKELAPLQDLIDKLTAKDKEKDKS